MPLARIYVDERYPSTYIITYDELVSRYDKEWADEVLVRDVKLYVNIPQRLIDEIKRLNKELEKAEKEIGSYYEAQVARKKKQ